MSLFVDLMVFVLIGASLCCHGILLAACGLLILVGDSTNGTIGLFFLSLPDLPENNTGSQACTEIRFIDEITGRYGASGLSWNPREDTYLRAAQIGGTFGFACGFILLCLVFCRQFCCPLPCTEFLMDVSCLGIQVGLAMVYLLYMSDGCYYFQCELASDGALLITAQCLWIFAFCLTKCMRPSAFARKKAIEDEKKKAEEEKKKQEEEAMKKAESGDSDSDEV